MKRALRSNFPRGCYLWSVRNAHWRALGIPEADCEKPKIAIVNSSSELAACFSHLDGVATVAETLPGFSVQSVFGAVVPSATPRSVVNKISTDMAKVLQSPETKTRMDQIGLAPVGDTPEQFDAFIRAEIDKWAKVVKASGATAD